MYANESCEVFNPKIHVIIPIANRIHIVIMRGFPFIDWHISIVLIFNLKNFIVIDFGVLMLSNNTKVLFVNRRCQVLDFHK
jgi:hypothetical protein